MGGVSAVHVEGARVDVETAKFDLLVTLAAGV